MDFAFVNSTIKESITNIKIIMTLTGSFIQTIIIVAVVVMTSSNSSNDI